MTTVPSNLRHNRALIEALVRERDVLVDNVERWRMTALSYREDADGLRDHPWRNLWSWMTGR